MIDGIDPILPATKAELYQLLVDGQNRGVKRPYNEVKSDLLRPLPPDYIKFKPVFERDKQTHQVKKTDEVPYIAWTDCLLILDYLCPLYNYEESENLLGDRVVVKARLTLHCQEGDVVAEGLGNEELGDTLFGGAIYDASAAAKRRCLATLGLGRYLYNGEDRPKKPATSSPSTFTKRKVVKPTNPAQLSFSSPSKGQLTREEWLAKFGNGSRSS